MKTKQLFTVVVAGLMMAGLITGCATQQTNVDRTVGSTTKKNTVPVTWRNFTRAETDTYFKGYAAKGGFGKFFHTREVVPIDEQVVIAMNRDTMYSVGVFDLTTPVTIMKPDTGDRFQSFQIIDEDQYTTEVVYKPGKYTFTQKDIGTRYVCVVVRTLVDSSDPADVKKVTQIQDQIKVSQSSPGKFDIPNWDQDGLEKMRDAINVLAATMKDADGAFGDKDEVDPVKFLMGCAIGWGGNPIYGAKYLNKFPEGNDGKTAYTIKLKDVPVDGFWSVSIYNKERFFEQNKYNSYSINSVTAKKDKDGSVTLHFGGDPKQPNFLYIMDGWNYIVRFYQPRKAILDGTYKFPELQPVK